MVSIRIICPVNPSKDPEKVRNAILMIFPDTELELSKRGYKGTAPTMDRFGRIIRRQRILDAARNVLLRICTGTSPT